MIRLVFLILLNATIIYSEWTLTIKVPPRFIIGNRLEVSCIVQGSIEEMAAIAHLPMELKCPENILCFRECNFIYSGSNLEHKKEFGKFQCNKYHYTATSAIEYMYRLDIIEEIWTTFNNSRFSCEINNKRMSIPISIFKEKEIIKNNGIRGIFPWPIKKNLHDINLYLIIIIASLLIISLSFNVGFCSWYMQLKKNNRKIKKLRKKEEEEFQLEQKIRKAKVKSRSLDLDQKKDAQNQLRRNQSLNIMPLMYPIYYPQPYKMISIPSTSHPSMYSLNTFNEENRLNKVNRFSEKLVVDHLNAENQTLLQNTSTGQVPSFKCAIESKMNMDLENSNTQK